MQELRQLWETSLLSIDEATWQPLNPSPDNSLRQLMHHPRRQTNHPICQATKATIPILAVTDDQGNTATFKLSAATSGQNYNPSEARPFLSLVSVGFGDASKWLSIPSVVEEKDLSITPLSRQRALQNDGQRSRSITNVGSQIFSLVDELKQNLVSAMNIPHEDSPSKPLDDSPLAQFLTNVSCFDWETARVRSRRKSSDSSVPLVTWRCLQRCCIEQDTWRLNSVVQIWNGWVFMAHYMIITA